MYQKTTFIQTILLLLVAAFTFQACNNSDDPVTPTLEIPTSYTSANFDANVTAERTVRTEIGDLTTAINAAESNAGTTTVSAITYPSTLKAVTLASYATKIDTWLVEIVKAANSGTGFQNPGANGTPTGDGGLLGSRLLDENGLELEQMVQKGSFGAALYNHALTVINGELTSASTDKLIEILGTDITFDPEKVTNAATYVRRRSNNDSKTGFLYDMRDNLIKAKAAIEGGSAFDSDRDAALAEFKLNWEKTNFATVIYYCNNAKTKLQAPPTNDAERGDALHSYAEGVAFAAGWLGLSDKKITDAQIEEILTKLLAPSTGTPESYKFLNDATLLTNLDEIITLIKGVYDFSDSEVQSFFTNN